MERADVIVQENEELLMYVQRGFSQTYEIVGVECINREVHRKLLKAGKQELVNKKGPLFTY